MNPEIQKIVEAMRAEANDRSAVAAYEVAGTLLVYADKLEAANKANYTPLPTCI